MKGGLNDKAMLFLLNMLFLGHQIKYLSEVGSTNVYLREMASEQLVSEGYVVVAENQIHGKGRKSKEWKSEPGQNLTFSVLLRPQLHVSDQFHLSQLVSLSVCDALRLIQPCEVSIKWPNDIFISGKKVCGLLIENTLKGSQIRTSIIGIGLNVNQIDFGSDLPNATSLRLNSNISYNLKEVLNVVLKCIENRYMQWKNLKMKEFNTDYHNLLYGIGKKQQFCLNGVMTEGELKGVNNGGLLIVEINGTNQIFDMDQIQLHIP